MMTHKGGARDTYEVPEECSNQQGPANNVSDQSWDERLPDVESG